MKSLIVLLIMASVIMIGGQAAAQTNLEIAEARLAAKAAEAEVDKAKSSLAPGRCRPDFVMWREPETPVVKAPVPAPVPAPVVSAPPVAAPPPVVKPPVAAAPPARAQAPVKPLQSAVVPVSPPIQTAKAGNTPNTRGNTPYGMQLPPLEADAPYNGTIYKKGEVLYMVGWITPDGRTVDETGNPIKDAILTRILPPGTILDVYKPGKNQ